MPNKLRKKMLFNLAHSLLREAGSVNGYGLFSFLLFFCFFIGVVVWAFRLEKNYLNHMGELPLDSGERPIHSTDSLPSTNYEPRP